MEHVFKTTFHFITVYNHYTLKIQIVYIFLVIKKIYVYKSIKYNTYSLK